MYYNKKTTIKQLFFGVTQKMIAYRKRLVIFMLINNITESQKQALDSVMNGRNVFITGGAGTGKTYLLWRFSPIWM